MTDLYLSNLKLFNLGKPSGGRLTLTTGVPVTTSDVTGATTVYYTPYIHDVIELWNGKKWLPTVFTETSLALGTVVKNAVYDIFGYLSSGVLTLEKLVWKSSTFTVTIASPGVVTWTAHGLENGDGLSFTTSGALPTGLAVDTIYYVINKTTDTFQLAANIGGTAINTSGSQSGTHTAYCTTKRGTEITYQDGRLCKSGDKTRFFLGSFQATTTSATEDSDQNRFLSNEYNAVDRVLRKYDSTASWTQTISSVNRPMNNSTANRVSVLAATSRVIRLSHNATLSSSANTVAGVSSIGIDSTNDSAANTYSISAIGVTPTAGTYITINPHFVTQVSGGHYFQALEFAVASTVTWYGGSARGLFGSIKN